MSFREDGKVFIQGGTIQDPDFGVPLRRSDGSIVRLSSGAIPEWLARVAYDEYARRYGRDQSFERLHQRGGFGPEELLMLLRKEANGEQAARDIRDAIKGAS